MTSIRQNIVENKTKLMGGSICLIMLFHTNAGSNCLVVTFVKNLCDIGVDMFLFLSGFTCAYSFARNPNVRLFYKKRFIRIVPAYLIVATLWYAWHYVQNDNMSWQVWLFNIFTLNFFIDGCLDFWYIPVIIVFYFLLPPYVGLIKRNRLGRYIPYLIVIGSFIGAFLHFFEPQSFLYLRLPIYLIGINAFYYSNNVEKDMPSYVKLFILIVALMGLFYVMYIRPDYYQLKYLFYIPLVLFIMQIRKGIQVRIFSILGIYTLELYLLHERVQWILAKHIESLCLLFVLSVCLACVGAYVLHRALKWVKI